MHEIALGAENGKAEMVLRPATSFKARIRTKEEGEGFPVEVRTLDSFELHDVDLIKIDCEGYELFVLQGGEETIRRERPTVFVEQKIGNLFRYGQPASYRKETQAVELLKSWGAKYLHDMGGDWCMGWE